MSTNVIETDNQNSDFISLIKLLDDDLNERYGNLQKQYSGYNSTAKLDNIIVLYDDNLPVACGALKIFNSESIEIKRIFVKKEYRKRGYSKLIIAKLEKIASRDGYVSAILETGLKQFEAINLYKGLGYVVTDNYEPYIGNENSICMKKSLT